MVVDQSLAGHETRPVQVLVTAEDIRAFATAIGDTNPIFSDEAAAQQVGYARIPAPPTFITRLRVPFAEAGLDPARNQILHGEQEYQYARPLFAGDIILGRHRVATIRQSGRGDMAVMTLEQLCDSQSGERIATGKATLVVRPASAAPTSAASAGKEKARPASKSPDTSTPRLEKHVTQEQINAYAEVSGDHNPIHIDPTAARAVGLDGTIAHGMLSMAFVGEMLTGWLSRPPRSPGWVARLRVRFQAMVRPDDTLICYGRPSELHEYRQTLEVWIENQHGDRIVTGDAEAALPPA